MALDGVRTYASQALLTTLLRRQCINRNVPSSFYRQFNFTKKKTMQTFGYNFLFVVCTKWHFWVPFSSKCNNYLASSIKILLLHFHVNWQYSWLLSDYVIQKCVTIQFNDLLFTILISAERASKYVFFFVSLILSAWGRSFLLLLTYFPVIDFNLRFCRLLKLNVACAWI